VLSKNVKTIFKEDSSTEIFWNTSLLNIGQVVPALHSMEKEDMSCDLNKEGKQEYHDPIEI
jgi:hypothetical protein